MRSTVFLTSTQKIFIREHCQQAIAEGVGLVKQRPPCAKVMSIVKVRHQEDIQSQTEMVIESLIGVKGVLKKSINIDWVQSQSSVYVLPFDGYQWRPVVFERTDSIANSMDRTLLEQIVTDRFSQVVQLREAQQERVPVHIFGVNKYIAIRTAAFPTFESLINSL